MALCKKCGQREQHTFPNGRTVALCAVCGWNALVELVYSPEVSGLTPFAPDARACIHDWQVITTSLAVCRLCGERR